MTTPPKKTNTRKSSSNKPKSRIGSSSLASSSKSTLFTKRNGLIVAALAAIVGLVFVAFSFAAVPSASLTNLPKYGPVVWQYNNCRSDGSKIEEKHIQGNGYKYRCAKRPTFLSATTYRVPGRLRCRYYTYDLRADGNWRYCQVKPQYR